MSRTERAELGREAAEQLAWTYGCKHGDEDELALLECQGTLYLAREPGRPPAGTPRSAIVALIQGVYELDPQNARRILRNRIYSTAAPSPMCWGMMKVAARRLTAPISRHDHGLALDARAGPALVDLSAREAMPKPARPALAAEPPPRRSDDEYLALAREAAAAVSREGPRYARDRPIGALLVSAEGAILESAVNTNSRNRTLHAEVNLIQNYYGRTGLPLPRGARIYSTLKPCRMCAGMIWHCAEDVWSLRVFYGENDSGPNARATILNALSPDRRLVARDADELKRELETHLGSA